jgi:serine protease
MNKLILTSLLAAAGIALLAQPAQALRDLSLKQQGELPRAQYYDLVEADKYELDKLVVKFVEDTRVRLRDGRLVSLEGRSLAKFESFLAAHPELKVERLIQSLDEDALDAYIARGEQLSGYDLADMNNYYLLRYEGRNEQPQQLLAELLADELVQTCYYEPIAEPATCGSDPAPATPNWTASQDYREAAPTGVDINYAWDFHPHGRGLSTYWWQDLEWGWCDDHEDFPDNFLVRNPPDSADNDHGTAVVGIVSACDDGKGMTGLTPDCRPTARNVSNHNSTADALIAIGNDLLTGETYLIEMHAQGPDQGTTCVCNCSQFRYIAMEYWQANFDAILANSANGRYCVEAAGNGSMDLDWSGYGGAFNLGVRDSQAIIVGAGTSGSVHNPTCWTNHGSRISAYGWGENVYTTGYGGLWNQTGCNQDYTATFSGTSSASPIVTGSAISLALIHRALDAGNAYPSPTLLRSRLQSNGTPQGPTDTWKEISVLPNMKGILAPDLAPYAPGGWTAQIVPSNTTGTNTVPANLPPAPATTYIDYSWVNWSRYATVDSSPVRLYRDDVWIASSTAGSHLPFTYRWTGDFSHAVRGGLHYLKLVADPLDAVDESIETNNTVVLPYRWDPIPLVKNVPQSFSRAPLRNPEGSSSNARDGFGNNGNFVGFWDVFAAMPQAGGTADLDVYLYNTAPTSTSGWTSTVATSSGISTVDFVGCNNNQVSDGDWASVLNYNDSNDGYTIEGDASFNLGSVPTTPTSAGSHALDAGEILDAFEFYAGSTGDVYFNFDVTGGNADIAVFFYNPSTTYFSRGSAALTLNGGGAGQSESGVFTVTETGFHGIVVCKNLRGELGEHASFTLYWGPPTGDLTTTTRAGWTHPLVARNSGEGSTGVLPAILNEGPSVADHGHVNIGIGTMPGGTNLGYFLNGPMVYESGNFGSLGSGLEGQITNRSIGTVKGGRHLLGAVLDVNAEVAEQLPDGETNNEYHSQFVWAPHALANHTPLTRSPAPNWTVAASPSFLHPGFNQDGYTLTTLYWSAVGAIPHLVGEQLNAHGYDYHSTDPETALVGPVSSSYTAPGRISFVMVNGNVVGNGEMRDVGITNNLSYPDNASLGNYTVEGGQRVGDLLPGTVTSGSLPAASILRTYDAFLTTGEEILVTLDNQSGVDLGIAVFDAGLSYADVADAALLLNAGGAGADESALFMPTVSGWHGIAVFRSGTSDLGVNAPYRVILGTRKPAPITDLSITPVDFSPGLAVVSIAFTPVTTDIFGNPLEVNRYRIYTVQTNGHDFSTPYVEDLPIGFNGGGGQLFYHALGWLNSAYLYLTAIDSDGMVLATSPGMPAEWLNIEPSPVARLSVMPSAVKPEAPAAEATR